jgi:hypothetical protein
VTSSASGKRLEAATDLALQGAQAAGHLHHYLRLHPRMRVVGRRAIQVADGPPDYLAILRDLTPVYVEVKEISERATWALREVKDHQASELSALPASQVLVCWLEERTTVALPWRVLGPLWREHAGRTGRAAAGEASLTLVQAQALGTVVSRGMALVDWSLLAGALLDEVSLTYGEVA